MSPYQLEGKYWKWNSSAKGALCYYCQVSRFEFQIQMNVSHTIKWRSSWFSNDHLSWRTVLVIETLKASALFSIASVSFPKLNNQISYLNYFRPHHSLDLNIKRIKMMEWSMVFVVGVLVHGFRKSNHYHQGLFEIIVIFRWSPFLTSNPGLQDIQCIEMQRCIGFFSQTEQPNILFELSSTSPFTRS